MKKLAFALMCLVSVAFFASCNKPVDNPDPSIAPISETGFVTNGQTVEIGEVFMYGFTMTANTQTKKDLAKLNITTTITNTAGESQSIEDVLTISGQEYRFADTMYFEAKEILGTVTFTATVTDVDGKTNSASITISVDQPAQPLTPVNFSWVRQGSNPGTGLEQYGLKWNNNAKEVFAVIEPVEGATLYGFSSDEWAQVTTNIQKVAAFTDGLHSVMSDFRGVSAWSSKDYDFVIGTLYQGQYHMIHITRGEVTSGSAGTTITITGQVK